MKQAPFIENRKTGPSRKYPSPAFLGRKTKTAIKQKTENKEAKKKKKKTGTKTKQNKLQPYLQQKDKIQMQNSFSIATIIIVFIIIIISIIIITIIIIAIIIIISRSSIVYHILKASALSCEKQIWELLRFLFKQKLLNFYTFKYLNITNQSTTTT